MFNNCNNLTTIIPTSTNTSYLYLLFYPQKQIIQYPNMLFAVYYIHKISDIKKLLTSPKIKEI